MAGVTGPYGPVRWPPGKVVADGSLRAELLTSHPDRHGVVFGKPAVAPIAAEAMYARGPADRVETVGGGFFAEAPAADVCLLSFVLRDWSDGDTVRVLRTIRHARFPAAGHRGL